MTHYETLGIRRDATQDQIKHAFRRLAKKLHPDKDSGGHDKMAALNEAYAVLSDPKRKAHYDESGSDVLPPSIETHARSQLLSLFATILEVENINHVAEARQQINHNLQHAKKQVEQFRRKLAILNKARGKVKIRTEGENLFEMLLNQRIKGYTEAIANHPREIEILNHMLVMLTRYESGEIEMPHLTFSAYNKISTGQYV